MENFIVIDRLEVSSAAVEENRVISNYTVMKDGSVDRFKFIYRFEEAVFKKENPWAPNLANLIAAQAAFNYGLFCKKIIFHGPFDRTDRRFILKMCHNTAREIYVKKLLEPNVFLSNQAQRIQAIKRDSYLNAEIQFDEPISSNQLPEWDVSPQRCAVLLSGGKESLLSYGILKEIAPEVYPVFINESGRHWYTSLNSYRSFREQFLETSRVWTNSDRLFCWMLRHLPFIRKDFTRIRSDEYPIRLWTVSVFLFGALPLMLKKGIGRIVIGDEYDTTRKESYMGISHYDGLYDQSRYFDIALTDYYRKKRWNVQQFSILRPLSELLVEKVLAVRYPQLQKDQVSCHAAHIEGGWVYPCGKCEKCHRIIGMLMALGADPRVCGYSDEQIAKCLKNLPKRVLHQESEVARHTLFLLKQKGLIGQCDCNEPHPEVEKLRFNPERSPQDSIPADLKAPLFQILLKYATGAVKKVHGKWVDTDL